VMTFSIEQAKDLFFDSPKVQRAVDRGFRKAFSRIGAFIRTAALTMLFRHKVARGFGVKSKSKDKHKGEVAPPGEPPFMHLGLIAKFLFFAYEPTAKSVVIGPVMLNRISPTALSSLEHGGPSLVSAGRGKRVRQVEVRERPFMYPALLQELPNAPKELTGCVTSN